jgi:pre-mRNA-splicing factor CWC26
MQKLATDKEQPATPPPRINWDDPARHFVDSLKVKPQKYRVPPNRFNIQPGSQWDGVDRSNGFERRFLLAESRRHAEREAAYYEEHRDL